MSGTQLLPQDEQAREEHRAPAWALMAVMGRQGVGTRLDQRMSRFFSDVVCIPEKAGLGLAVALCRSAPGEGLSGKGLGLINHMAVYG